MGFIFLCVLYVTCTQIPCLPADFWIFCIWLYIFGTAQLKGLSDDIDWIGMMICARVLPEIMYWTTYLLEYDGPGLLLAINAILVMLWQLATYDYI